MDENFKYDNYSVERYFEVGLFLLPWWNSTTSQNPKIHFASTQNISLIGTNFMLDDSNLLIFKPNSFSLDSLKKMDSTAHSLVLTFQSFHETEIIIPISILVHILNFNFIPSLIPTKIATLIY